MIRRGREGTKKWCEGEGKEGEKCVEGKGRSEEQAEEKGRTGGL